MRRDERGAILLLSAAGIVLAMIGSSLAIDLGFLASEARSNQKVADLAALDAARALAAGNPVTAANDSAARHNVSSSAVGVTCGMSVSGPFTTCAPGHTAVKVAVTTPHTNRFPFTPGGQSVSRSAVSAIRGLAGFSLGSGVANVNTKKSILDPMLGQMLGGAAGNLNIANYQGLANGTVTLEGIRTQLVAMGFSVGTPAQLLDADLTFAQLYTATANALVAGGDTTNAAVFCRAVYSPTPANCTGTSIAAKSTVVGTIKLRRLLTVATGYESAAMAARLNVFQFLTGTAELSNNTHTAAGGINVPAINLGLAQVGTTSGKLTLIEAPQMYFGPAGLVTDPPHVTTSQVDLTVSTSLLSLIGLNIGTVTVHVTGGQGDGWLTSATCTTSPPQTTIHAVAKAATVTASATPLVGAPITISSNAPGGTTNPDLIFQYPLYPNPSNPPMQSVTAASPPAQPTLALTASGSIGGIAVGTVAAAIDSVVIQPLLDSLGLSVGTADVLGLDPLTCTVPALFK